MTTLDKLLGPVIDMYPLTGDERRWPDCLVLLLTATPMAIHVSERVCRLIGIYDEDLQRTVRAAWCDLGRPENEAVLAHVLDAAIDESDRRAGRPVRPFTR